MKSSDFYFDLPKELIAQTPVEPRDSSRLLTFNIHSKEVKHEIFSDIISYLRDGDLLVINNTRVIPARLFANVSNYSKKAEILLLKRVSEKEWECLVRPGKKLRVGTIGTIGDKLKFKIIDNKDTGRIVRFEYDGIFEQILDEIGNMPLPPYIHEKLKNKERYQTVYSKEVGSAAAPTAGLHFTQDLMDKLKDKGIEIAEVLLHIGLGTFRPVTVDTVEEHKMHSEWYQVNEETAKKINKAVDEGRRIICVGTTSARVLETVADESGHVQQTSGNTSIFIYPGYKFKIVKNLITNFHLPESTLIMLVSALAGKEEVMNIYNKAVKMKYRFFSFGDAMFLYNGDKNEI